MKWEGGKGVIKVEIWAEIRRLFYVGKKAKKDIARILGIHVQTVRKLLNTDYHGP